MQDEKNTSTFQCRSGDELAERLVSLINDTAGQLEDLLKDVEKSKDTIQKFFDKVDGKTVENAELLRQFGQITMQGAMVEMLKRAAVDLKRSDADCEDTLVSIAKQMGFDAETIGLGMILPEE